MIKQDIITDFINKEGKLVKGSIGEFHLFTLKTAQEQFYFNCLFQDAPDTSELYDYMFDFNIPQSLHPVIRTVQTEGVTYGIPVYDQLKSDTPDWQQKFNMLVDYIKKYLKEHIGYVPESLGT